MLRVHGYAASINVRKVLWLLAELHLEFELIDRGTSSRPVSEPSFQGLNPFGLVPLLEDGDFVLAESNTILRYLVRRENRTDLLPAGAVEAALVERWIDWQATDFNDSWRYSFARTVRRKSGFDDAARIAQSQASFTAKVRVLEEQLASTGAYVAGAHFTLADIPIGLSIRRWLAMEYEKPCLPNVLAYYRRLCAETKFLPFGGPDSLA